MRTKRLSLMVCAVLCLCACFVLACGAGAKADEPLLVLYSDEKLTTELEKVNGVYQIPVQTDIFAKIDASSAASSARLVMGDDPASYGYDLMSYDEWNSGDWGEQHENVVANVWYNNSCTKNNVSSYTMQLVLDEQVAASVLVNVTTNGAVSVDSWQTGLYYMTHDNGNVTITGRNKSGQAGWTQLTEESGFTVAANKKIHFEGIPRVDHSMWIYTALVRSDGAGNIIWWDDENQVSGTFDGGDLSFNAGKGLRSTRGIAPGTSCVLWMSTGGIGYDEAHLVFPVTVESDLLLNLSSYQENEVQVSTTISMPNNMWLNFEAHAPGADALLVFHTDDPDAVITPDGEGDNASTRYAQCSLDSDGYAYFSYTPNDTCLTVPDNTASLTRYVFVMARYTDEAGNSSWVASRKYPVTIHFDSTIDGTFTFDKATGTVARDGVFSRQITFTPASGDPGIDWLGMRVEDANGKWISDSHWVVATNNTATVSLPPLELEPGTYTVKVYAVRKGAKRLDAPDTFQLEVTAPESVPENSHILISMKDSCSTQDSNPIFVYYDKPADIEDVILQVQIVGPNGDIWLEDTKPGAYFWQEWSSDREGNYTLRVKVYSGGDVIDSRESQIVFSATEEITVARPANMPDSVAAGSDLTFTVNKPVNADGYEIIVFYDLDGEIVNLRTLYNLKDASTDVTIQAAELPPEGKIVRVGVYAWGENANADNNEFRIPVVQAQPQITLTAEGLENGSVPVNSDVRFVVTDSENREIRTVCFFDGNDYRDHEDGSMMPTFEWTTPFPEAGTYSVYALVSFEEWDPAWDELEDFDGRNWIPTNVIQVQATAVGQVGEFVTYLNYSGPVRRGNVIPVTYMAAANASHYFLDVFEIIDAQTGEEEWILHTADLNTDPDPDPSEDQEAGRTALHTAVLEAGKTYHVYATAQGVGYTGRDANHIFEISIVEPGSGSSDIILKVSAGQNNTINTGEGIQVSAYAPGADGITLFYDYMQNDDWFEDYGGNSFSNQVNPYWAPGSYQMVARAWYPKFDENNQPVWEVDENGDTLYDGEGNQIQAHDPVDSDPVTITVNAAGTVSIELPTNPALPSYLAPGSGLEFTVPFISGGDWMNVDVQVQNEDGQRWGDSLYHWDSSGADISRTISWDELADVDVHPGQTIVISANGGKAGYEVIGWERFIPVVELQDDDTPKAHISFDDTESDGYSALVNTDVGVTIQAEADRNPSTYKDTVNGTEYTITEKADIQTVRFFDGNRFWDDFGPDEEGGFHAAINRGDPATLSLYAMVTYAEWNPAWDDPNLDHDPRKWYPTNVLTLNLTSNGNVAPFTISLDKASVVRGGKVTVTFDKPTGSNAATDYWLNIQDAELDWFWADEQQNTATFDTTNLWPGTYRISATGVKEGLTSYNTPWTLLTVTEPQIDSGAIRFTLNGEESDVTVYLGERVEASVLAPGAKGVGLFLDGEPWHLDEDGNYIWGEDQDSLYDRDNIWWRNAEEVGPHEIKAVALFEGSDQWTEVTRAITVRSLGNITFDRTQIPPYFVAGENPDDSYEFDISLPEHAATMTISVQQAVETDDENNPWNVDTFIYKENLTEEFSVSIPQSRLVEGQQIWIDLEAEGTGYATAYEHFEAPVLGEPTGSGLNLVFEENAPDENHEVTLNQHMRIALIPAQGRTIQEIRFYHGTGYWNGDQDQITPASHPEWFREEDNAFVAEYEFDRNEFIGLRPFYAYYKLDGETEWSMTEPVVVNVVALGTVGSFDFTSLEPITVTRGTPVEFNFTQAAAGEDVADNYWIDAMPAEGGGGMDPARKGDGTRVTMFTEGLPEGTYKVWGRAGRQGWLWSASDNYVLVTVTEPTEEKTITLHPQYTDLVTMESTNWYAYAPGAASIQVEGYMVDASGNRNYFFQPTNEEWEPQEDGTRPYLEGWDAFGGHAGTAYIRATATYSDGTTKSTEPIQVRVTAPNGELAPLKVYSALYDGSHANFEVQADDATQQYELTIHMYYEGAEQNNHDDRHETGEHGGHLGTFDYPNAGDAHIGIFVYQSAYGYNDRYDQIWMRPFTSSSVLDLPSSLTSIEDEAFEGGSFTKVIIPDTVTSIGNGAFDHCDNLWAVEVPSSVTSFGAKVFETGNITIYGYENSAAETYARNTGTDFICIR